LVAGKQRKEAILELDEGFRIRHWLGANSTKMYNELNVLRFETTVNDPSAFRGYRRKQGAPRTAKKELLPLRTRNSASCTSACRPGFPKAAKPPPNAELLGSRRGAKITIRNPGNQE
jgi:hypothetical protein